MMQFRIPEKHFTKFPPFSLFYMFNLVVAMHNLTNFVKRQSLGWKFEYADFSDLVHHTSRNITGTDSVNFFRLTLAKNSLYMVIIYNNQTRIEVKSVKPTYSRIIQKIWLRNLHQRDSSVGVVTRYELNGPGIGFRTRPEQPCGPPSLPYNGSRVSSPRLKQSGRGVKHPPSPSSEVKGKVQL